MGLLNKVYNYNPSPRHSLLPHLHIRGRQLVLADALECIFHMLLHQVKGNVWVDQARVLSIKPVKACKLVVGLVALPGGCLVPKQRLSHLNVSKLWAKAPSSDCHPCLGSSVAYTIGVAACVFSTQWLSLGRFWYTVGSINTLFMTIRAWVVRAHSCGLRYDSMTSMTPMTKIP